MNALIGGQLITAEVERGNIERKSPSRFMLETGSFVSHRHSGTDEHNGLSPHTIDRTAGCIIAIGYIITSIKEKKITYKVMFNIGTRVAFTYHPPPL